ncbi:hypothetical protein [Anaerosporobacter sp.]
MGTKAVGKNKIGKWYLNIAVFIAYILMYVISFSKFRSNINYVLTGSKWHNSGFDIVFIIQEAIHTVLPQLVFILFSIIVIKIFFKANNIEVRSGMILFNLLIFGLILSCNSLVKAFFANTSTVMINNDMQLDVLWKSIKKIDNFCTGLDIALKMDTIKGALQTLILNINVFSVVGFVYLYNKLQKEMKKSVPILIVLIILFLILAMLFGFVDLSGLIVWSD